MKIKAFILFVLFAVTIQLNAQEANAILCSDGIDNDGDGLVDCDDPECQEVPNMGCITCFQDGLSFVDEIISYDPECEDTLDPTLTNPEDALGLSDFSPTPNEPYGIGRVTLGEGGSITLGFTNNIVTNSGDPEADVWVFEVGFDIEPTTTDFRPIDANTISIITAAGVVDSDGDGFYEFGQIGGATSFVDLDALVPGQAFGTLRFDAIKLTDVFNVPCGAASAGADIDAVCALSSLPVEICGNEIDDDGDGLVDCDDPDISNDCCCLDPNEINLGEDLEICSGQTATLDAGDDWDTYEWSTSEVTQSIQVTEEGVYSVTVSDSCTVETSEIFVNVLPAFTSEMNFEICEGDSVVVNEEVYFEAGEYKQEFLSQEGCDSIVTINVVQNPSYEITLDTSICAGEFVLLNGQVYETTGQYEQFLLSEEACDSVIVLNLNVIMPFEETQNVEICEGDSYNFYDTELTDSGTYLQTVSGEECDSTFILILTVNPVYETQESYTFCSGESLEINGEIYTETGMYEQSLVSQSGCDSILTIILNSTTPVFTIDFDDCQATIVDDANESYEEFTAELIEESELECGFLNVEHLYRNNPEVNIHSCTPGIDGSVAMCVGSLDECIYSPDNDKAVRLRISFSPYPGETISFGCLSFYEKSPDNFEWIGGGTGLNNFPKLYGIRILRDNVEVFKQTDIATTQEWTKQEFTFNNLAAFDISVQTFFDIELLPYCLEGNGALVSAWDLDQLEVSASCRATTGNITGLTRTAEGFGIENVEMINYCEEIDYTAVGEHILGGFFSFPSNPLYYDYTVIGSKNDDPLNGVSTLDLILIQKHILGLQTFDSPYQYIAADINNSESVSAIDLVELRKLILGIHTEFPNNESWRFIANDPSLSLNEPFVFNEQIDIENLSADVEGVDFTGVKIGDINLSASANVIGMSSESRNAKNVELLLEKQDDLVHVKATRDLNLSGMQMSLWLEQNDFNSLVPGALNLTEQNYSSLNGQLILIWFNSSPITIHSGDILFSLNYDGNLTSLMLSEQINPELYLNDHLELNTFSLNRSEEAIAFQVLQNVPNPFDDETRIHFQLDNASEVELSIIDINGRLIMRQTKFFESGLQHFNINAEALNSTGVMFYQLKTNEYQAVKKMIRN